MVSHFLSPAGIRLRRTFDRSLRQSVRHAVLSVLSDQQKQTVSRKQIRPQPQKTFFFRISRIFRKPSSHSGLHCKPCSPLQPEPDRPLLYHPVRRSSSGKGHSQTNHKHTVPDPQKSRDQSHKFDISCSDRPAQEKRVKDRTGSHKPQDKISGLDTPKGCQSLYLPQFSVFRKG